MALKGIKVIEMIGLAPGPFCGTILADFGATVTVVQKLNPPPVDLMSNGKKAISVNLKTKEGVEILKKLCTTSDVLLDTYRPGVLEKLGLGPKVLLKENSRLIYAQLTGYGQSGCYRNKAGHDINYVAMSGLLSKLTKNGQPPQPPLNIIADFAGGSVICVLGILLALLDRTRSGKGQIIDASMTEGAAYIGAWLYKSQNTNLFSEEPGKNMLDGGFPFYTTYKTKDNKFMAVGSLEPQFFANLLVGLNLSEEIYTQGNIDICKKKFEEIFLTKTQEEWNTIFENLDACVTPVLDINHVGENVCHSTRKSFYKDKDNYFQPEPAPKLSTSPGIASGKQKAPKHGEHTVMVLQELGYSNSKIQDLIKNSCVYAYTNSHL
ncbi:alpha-methylacyl-CoA racemase [Vanessa cardui]|uniref:alpha-methylacyl-CoA racemase n=1 Tax=Vanessa cardui TaxID=171605 RepID=UPI001F12B773|nr:alpha-methylacyl-CoA racemase [Vanessa cardui]